MSDPMDYASSGVDIDLEGAAVASQSVHSTFYTKARNFSAPVISWIWRAYRIRQSSLALATDGVGSKLQLLLQSRTGAV